MPPARRLNITRALRAAVQDAARRLPEFAHLKASRILIVAGEARRASWATIRPLGPVGKRGGKPVVRVKGRQMLYVITLRPRFFRVATPAKRVETLLHELFHISKRFDGTLHAGRRHSKLRAAFDRRLGPLVERFRAGMPPELAQAFATHGEVLARQWLEKPGPTPTRTAAQRRRRPAGRRIYTEKQLFVGPVQMVTRPEGRRPPKDSS